MMFRIINPSHSGQALIGGPSVRIPLLVGAESRLAVHAKRISSRSITRLITMTVDYNT